MQALQVFALTVEYAHVGPEKFVSRTDQEIAIERAHIDGAVGRVVHGINVGQGTGLAGDAHNLSHVIDGSDRIGGVSHCDQPGVT